MMEAKPLSDTGGNTHLLSKIASLFSLMLIFHLKLLKLKFIVFDIFYLLKYFIYHKDGNLFI